MARLNGFPARESLRGRLLCASWGGTHGLIPLDEDQVEPGAGPAVQLQHQPRSVGDVISLINLLYGREMEMVDPRYLLRYTDGYAIAPLQARVRFKDSRRSEWERSMILHSCERVLRGYLGQQVSGGIDLVEDRGTRR